MSTQTTNTLPLPLVTPPSNPSSSVASPQSTRGNNRQTHLMRVARAQGTIVPVELARLLYGGEPARAHRALTFQVLEARLGTSDSWILPPSYKDPDLGGRKAAYEGAARFGRALPEADKEARALSSPSSDSTSSKETDVDRGAYTERGVFDRATHEGQLINASPFGLHPAMFLPTLKLMCDEEQKGWWVDRAERGEIIGTYVQTELGHGTFLRGLETTATLDLATDEWVIHSPTLTSAKYWPGGLGFSCSHAIVMARLLIPTRSSSSREQKYADYGPQPFLLRLRSSSPPHAPLPGITLGDIGPKMGLNTTDNGFAKFNQVRIPRRHMLMRDARVEKDGTFTKRKGDGGKAAYGTMIWTRNLIVETVAFQLAMAAVIAIRYSVVREQGVGMGPAALLSSSSLQEQEPASRIKEVAIIHYRTQQYRLFTALSHAFALVFASQALDDLYKRHLALSTFPPSNAPTHPRNPLALLPSTHLYTALIKALSTTLSSALTEDLRRCCGGHGYSLLSGLPEIVTSVVPTATLEGENVVMWGQGARGLVKIAKGIREGRFGGERGVEGEMEGCGYLVEGYERGEAVLPRDDVNWGDIGMVVKLFEERASTLIFEAESLVREGEGAAEAWNEHAMALSAAARAHAELFVLRAFVRVVHGQLVLSPETHSTLSTLLSLHALSTLLTPTICPSSPSPSTFLTHSSLRPSHLRSINATISQLLKELVPEAVRLTDGWEFSDAMLRSALGCADGDVYERMWAWTGQVGLNGAGVVGALGDGVAENPVRARL